MFVQVIPCHAFQLALLEYRVLYAIASTRYNTSLICSGIYKPRPHRLLLDQRVPLLITHEAPAHQIFPYTWRLIEETHHCVFGKAYWEVYGHVQCEQRY